MRPDSHTSLLLRAASMLCVVLPATACFAVDVREVPNYEIHVSGQMPTRVAHAVLARFDNGHTIVFDKDTLSVRDWVTSDGTHLLASEPYGNAFEFTRIGNDIRPATDAEPAMPEPIRSQSIQTAIRGKDLRKTFHMRWAGNDFWGFRDWRKSAGGVEFKSWIPIDAWGAHATVWETWSPVGREVGGVEFSGLSRKIEIRVPSFFLGNGFDGYSVCLNDGFGVAGRCGGAVTLEYSARDGDIVRTQWEADRDIRGAGHEQVRHSRFDLSMRHRPMLWADFPQGTLLIQPTRYTYPTTYCWTNYARHGRESLYPNLRISAGLETQRYELETFEYLWADEPGADFKTANKQRLAEVRSGHARNAAPQVRFTWPTYHQVEIDAVPFHWLEASAFDCDGEVKRMRFFLNGKSIKTFTKRPFAMKLPALPEGEYMLAAEALDDSQARAMTKWGLNVTRPRRRTGEWFPPIVRPPSGLRGEADRRAVHLNWNYGLEEDLAGYVLERLTTKDAESGDEAWQRLNETPLTSPYFVDRSVTEGRAERYRVSAVNRDGVRSLPSASVEVTPQPIAPVKVAEGVQVIFFEPHGEVAIDKAVTAVFGNGHRIVFDIQSSRVRSWTSDQGEHLMYPVAFGDGINITKAQNECEAIADASGPLVPARLCSDPARYKGYSIDGGRITFTYELPLKDGEGEFSIWETWSPVSKRLGDTKYGGLIRRIDVQAPSGFAEGFSVCPNDGFGLDGSCDDATIYDLSWGDFEQLREHQLERGKPFGTLSRKKKGRTVFERADPRAISAAVQCRPFIAAHYPRGTLLIAPRQYYHATAFELRNYAQLGKDGIWPNFRIDCGPRHGRRFTAESFEYLWTSDVRLEPPQRHIDARFHYRRKLADLYGIDGTLVGLDIGFNYGLNQVVEKADKLPPRFEVFQPWAEQQVDVARQLGFQRLITIDRAFWLFCPYLYDDDFRLAADHGANAGIRGAFDPFFRAGIDVGWQVNNKAVYSAPSVVLSDNVHLVEDWNGHWSFPRSEMSTDGMRLLREHPYWINGWQTRQFERHPTYNWLMMSYTQRPGYYDQVLYPMIVMYRKLGWQLTWEDNMGGAMEGVETDSGYPRPAQPYFWHWHQDLARHGIARTGELLAGWGTCNVGKAVAESARKNPWFYSHLMTQGERFIAKAAGRHGVEIKGNRIPWFTPQVRHVFCQMYCATLRFPGTGYQDWEEHRTVAQFGEQFLSEHGPPDRVVLDGLRFDSGHDQWIWNNVFWEYRDGRRVRYPDYGAILEE